MTRFNIYITLILLLFLSFEQQRIILFFIYWFLLSSIFFLSLVFSGFTPFFFFSFFFFFFCLTLNSNNEIKSFLSFSFFSSFCPFLFNVFYKQIVNSTTTNGRHNKKKINMASLLKLFLTLEPSLRFYLRSQRIAEIHEALISS